MIKKYNITVNGNTYEVEVEEVGVGTSQVSRPTPVSEPNTQPKPKSINKPTQAPSGGDNSISAPMPGTISDVSVTVGQEVKKGDVLLILEAMKMENEIMAPIDGKVSVISVSKGASVSSGDALITLG